MSKPILTAELPVIIFGVKDGHIVPQEIWDRGSAPQQEFANLAEAQKVFPDLSLNCSDSKQFAGPVLHNNRKKQWTRFDTREHYNWIMED